MEQPSRPLEGSSNHMISVLQDFLWVCAEDRMQKGECGKETGLQSRKERQGCKDGSGGKGVNSGSIQRSRGWDVLMDWMWDVKERREGWLQGAG